MSDQDNLEKRFHEGLCLAAGGDYQRASAALLDCVVAEPGSGEFAREFLANLGRLVPPGGERVTPPATAAEAVQRAAARADWAEVLKNAPRLIANHPWHVPTLLAIADACVAKGHGEAEVCYWRAALQAASGEAAINRRAGQALGRLGKYDEAIACWRRVEMLDPSDEEAPRLIAALTIAKSRHKAGLDNPDDSTRPSRQSAVKRAKKTVRRPVYSHLAGLTPSADRPAGLSLSQVQQLEAAIRDRPSIPELYLQLSQLYLDKDRDYDAERLLAKGREATDHDSQVQQMWEEVTMLRHARRVEIAEQEIKSADTPQAREALSQAKKERDRTDLEIFRGRVKRQPESAASHYELGLRLMRAEKLREACEHLEKALEGSDERSPAALELGHCHAQLGDLPQALRHYRLAADTASADQWSEKKEALHRASELAAKIKLNKLAERYSRQLSTAN